MEILYKLIYDLSMTFLLISSSKVTIYMSADNRPLGIDDQEASKASRMTCLFHISILARAPT